ncbi:MAG: ROK family protein [Bacteroidetes bacterium]|nr:ROK family protein [Bacteroidota bacterium]
MSEDNHKTVLTLDAGGTNFVFTAIAANKEIVSPIQLPSNGNNLSLCLQTIKDGFTAVKKQLKEAPAAISFAFPGPSDFPNGIIGDLFNMPAFRGGVPLGGILEEEFNIPVFINNDGDLYAYGEAIAGYLPYINQLMEKAGNEKRFRNLVGFTLGTGFGAGIVRNGELYLGDNSGAAEVWLLRNRINPTTNAEEGISIRAIKRVYAECAKIDIQNSPEPKDIYEIGIGMKPGNRDAAIEAFRQMAVILGDVISNVLTLTDGIAVIGGGIAGAQQLIMPALLQEMRSNYISYGGNSYPRLAQRVCNLDDADDLEVFIKGETKEILIPGTSRTQQYDAMKRVGVAFSKIGTSQAIALGAYNYAVNKLGN